MRKHDLCQGWKLASSKMKKHGEEVQGLTLKEVTLNPSKNFILVSTTNKHK